jgi:hypothetical protein
MRHLSKRLVGGFLVPVFSLFTEQKAKNVDF